MRSGPVCAIAFAFAAAAAYVIRADLHGNGVRNTLLYELTGKASFIIFYGLVIAGIISQLRMLPMKDEWMTASDDTVCVGNRQIVLAEVSNVEVRRNWIGLRELVFHQADGTEFKTKVYLLSRPLQQLVPELKSLILNSQVRSQIGGR
jgi:hypothetical protein